MPLSKGQVITDVKQHLKEMYPAAFAEKSLMKSESRVISEFDNSVEAKRQPEVRIGQIKSEYHEPDTKLVIQPRLENGQKHKSDDSSVMKNPAGKRVANVSNHDDTERLSTSSQNHHVRSLDMSDENYGLLLQEFEHIVGQIALLDHKKKTLLAREDIVKESLRAIYMENYRNGRHTMN